MKRIGFHYFPDTQHYRQSDLDRWLPELVPLGASWLILQAPQDRAIPEAFIRGLFAEGIEPILHFPLSPCQLLPIKDFDLLFQVYERWGIRYITLFDAPNIRKNWQNTNWAQIDLVERFLDIYMPLAESCLRFGLTPVFPPLKPGGDYWDTAFLRASLRGIQRRGHTEFLKKFIIGAYAWVDEKDLNWGAGGPERWPGVQPYITPDNAEDQRGFRIFDWYNALVRSILVEPRPIFLFGMGQPGQGNPTLGDLSQKYVEIGQLLKGETVSGVEPLPKEIIGGAFWLLSTTKGDRHEKMAWYSPNGMNQPVVARFLNSNGKISKNLSNPQISAFPIQHYVLLPSYDGDFSEYHFSAIRPLIKKYRPTIGFSIEEAAKAQKVTVIGSNHDFSESELNHLRSQGCIVQRILENGTDIAT